MSQDMKNKKLLGINSLGRIGKQLLWNMIHLRHFDGVVVNCGREVGKKLDDLIQIIEHDSTYGSIHKFLFGMVGRKAEIKILDAEQQLFSIEGIPVKVLRTARNPKDIDWLKEGVKIVVDCTGQFTDPNATSDQGKPCLRGHLEAGALKVINSAPFKSKSAHVHASPDAITMIYGINHLDYNPAQHHVISAASCTTTGLAHLMKPLLEHEDTAKIMTAYMSTIHAATNTQSILDNIPKAGASDLRKSRSMLNNIILSTTGAAKALELVIPKIKSVGFMADSVRIPTSTVSLINLNLTLQTRVDKKGNPVLSGESINRIYKDAAAGPQKDLLVYTERQNVSADMIGTRASVVLEAHETHIRTFFMPIPGGEGTVPVSHARICGWYDNELGSYTYSLSKLVQYIDETLP